MSQSGISRKKGVLDSCQRCIDSMCPKPSADLYRRQGYAIVDNNISTKQAKCNETISFLLDEYFLADSQKWSSMKSEEFHEYTYECQKEIIATGIQDTFLLDNEDIITSLTGISTLYRESTFFLRAIRPKIKAGVEDNLGFHRETMFTDSPQQTSKAHNIWIPLTSPNKDTAVRLIPGSNQIPDSALVFSEDSQAPRVERGSYGHKLGMLYKPKKIDKLEKTGISVPMMPKVSQFCLFSAMTIHGAGKNDSQDIRLSLSMAVIDRDDIQHNKSYIASGGQPHYVPLNWVAEDAEK